MAATLCSLTLLGATASLSAKTPEWTDGEGHTIKGEPVEVMGPWALFRAGSRSGQWVPLQALPDDTCVRLAQALRDMPGRATSWSEAKGRITRELPGRVMRVVGGKLEPVDLAGVPEPEVLVLLFGSHNDGESWRMLNNFEPSYRRLRARYPGRMEALFYGVRHDTNQHANIATHSGVTWLVTDFPRQHSLGAISSFAPGEGIAMVAVSREGVPLIGSRASTLGEVQQFLDGLGKVMFQTDPSNPATWHERQRFLDLARPVWWGAGQSDPVMVGDPLRDDGLRQRGITRVRATIAVGADGAPLSVSIDGRAGVPEKWIQPLEQALVRNARYSAAIRDGVPVAGRTVYDHAVLPEEPISEAERAWLDGTASVTLPLRRWLVLKPVAVPEQLFSVVEGVNEDGVVMMSAYEADTAKVSRGAQMNAFNSDWFGPEGPGDLAPQEGDGQTIDEEVLTWRSLEADEFGWLNLQSFERRDYCIGYAWTELEVPQDLDAWLGIGSDDGLRIWLNGELVHDRWVRRMSKIDDDIVPLRLKAGKNRILIKIQNATGDWSFVARLRLKAP